MYDFKKLDGYFKELLNMLDIICWWFFEAGKNSLGSRLNSIVSMSLIRANVSPGISVLECQQKPLGIVYRTLGMVYCSQISTYVHVSINVVRRSLVELNVAL